MIHISLCTDPAVVPDLAERPDCLCYVCRDGEDIAGRCVFSAKTAAVIFIECSPEFYDGLLRAAVAYIFDHGADRVLFMDGVDTHSLTSSGDICAFIDRADFFRGCK